MSMCKVNTVFKQQICNTTDESMQCIESTRNGFVFRIQIMSKRCGVWAFPVWFGWLWSSFLFSILTFYRYDLAEFKLSLRQISNFANKIFKSFDSRRYFSDIVRNVNHNLPFGVGGFGKNDGILSNDPHKKKSNQQLSNSNFGNMNCLFVEPQKSDSKN